MLENKMYDNRQESLWFPLTKDVRGKVLPYTATTPGGISYYSNVIHTYEGRNHGVALGEGEPRSPKLSRKDKLVGYIIPTERVKNLNFDGLLELLEENSTSDEEVSAISQSPSQMIMLITFTFVGYYDHLDRISRYGFTNTPILAYDEGKGGCKERASVAAAVAKINGVPYRIVGTSNLAPDEGIREETLAQLLNEYNGELNRTMREESQRAEYPFWWSRPYLSESHTPQWKNIPLEENNYQFFYPHWWIEVEENGEWVPVDTVGWNPINFPFFKDGLKQRFICKEVDLSEVDPKNSLVETSPTSLSYTQF